MNFEIIKDNFKDTTIKIFIVGLLKFFNQNNEEKIAKVNNKEDQKKLLQELVDFLESSLKIKFSLNFNVFINEYPSYALKYEARTILILKHENYEILIFKNPFICIPGKFNKNLEQNQRDEIEKYIKDKGESLVSEHIKLIKYFNKSSLDEKLEKLKPWDEKKLLDIVVNDIAYFNTICDGKDITDLALLIQHDITKSENEYKYFFNKFSWGVVCSKNHLYTHSFVGNSDIFIHFKITDPDKKLKSSKLRETDIVIYKRSAIFESVLKNMVRYISINFSGKFHGIDINSYQEDLS